MNADDVRKMLDSVFDRLSPAKAQELAKALLGDDRREQAQKLAGDLMESAQRNRDRVRDLIAREVAAQVKTMGVATQADLEALKRRVRELERASGAGTTARSGAAKRTSSPAKRTAASKVGESTGPTAPKRVSAASARAKQPAKGAAASETPASDPPTTPSTPKRSPAARSAGRRPTGSGPSTP